MRTPLTKSTHLQWKLEAAFGSPLPLYRGSVGYWQTGRVTALSSCALHVIAGSWPCSTH